MYSRSSSHGPSAAGQEYTSVPPPPAQRQAPGSPAGYRNAPRPLSLHTALPYVPSGHLVSTPASTSQLSSPFTLSNPNTSTGAHPTPTSQAVSPAMNRLSGNFNNMAYDPRDWASGQQNAEAARQRNDVYGEPLNTPPPPYTGDSAGASSQAQRNSISSTFSRPATFSSVTSSNTTPITQDAMASPDGYQHLRQPKLTSRQMFDLRRASAQNRQIGSSSNQNQGRQPYQSLNHAGPSNYVPPPPPRTETSNSVRNVEPSTANVAELYTRRSNSAGPMATPSRENSYRQIDRNVSGSNFDTARNGTHLPGPPPGAPPNFNRSRSASAHTDSSNQTSTGRSRPPRLYIKHSNLATIPATPSSSQPSTSARPVPFPLRIDTLSVQTPDKAIAIVDTSEQNTDLKETYAQPPARTGSSALARRTAVKRQTYRSKSRHADDQTEPPSSTFSCNPWASALEEARSPQAENGVQALKDKTRADSNAHSHTPPDSPTVYMKPSARQDRPESAPKVLPTPPLSQKPLYSADSFLEPRTQDQPSTEEEYFMSEALQRYSDFLKSEQTAGSDLERLRLFMKYIQQESNIRRDRYAEAFESEEFSSEAQDMPIFTAPRQRRASARNSHHTSSQPPSPVPVPLSAGSNGAGPGAVKDFRPALSPIASMEYDEMSSRGRAPSRWWESQTGSRSDGIGQGVHRSKRESKYMSLSKAIMQGMETEMEPLPEDMVWAQSTYHADKKDMSSLGYYDENPSQSAMLQPLSRSKRKSMLDISRFITLPPPYPRHHPAVNNSHPDLAAYRTTVRTLSDLNDARKRSERYNTSISALRSEHKEKTAASRTHFRNQISNQLRDGTISFQEAAEVEAGIKGNEHAAEQSLLQSEFDILSDVIVNPLHDDYNSRVENLTHSLECLQRELFAQATNANGTSSNSIVEAGDDQPDLLETLTTAKWLFDTRETVYTELHGLLSRRNEAYKAIVALPYHQAGNEDKVRDTEAFFDKDAATRYATFCADSLKRFESFLACIESNALQCINAMSDAFWDITPGLVDLLGKIPNDPSKLDLEIPEDELGENPSYRQHPQQYLYLLLKHAQKSSYQYIDGQVNLHLLIHQIKIGSLEAHYRASRAQQALAGDQSIDLADTRTEDKHELDEEVKQRVFMIEEQWRDALGGAFETVGKRVKDQLVQRGAWEEISDEAEG